MQKRIKTANPKSLSKKPPLILGGFSNKYEAFAVLKTLKYPNIIRLRAGFVQAKAILQAADKTYYPVICDIDQSSAGELYDSQFVATNYPDEFISSSDILPYIGKERNEIFPYDYETLSLVPDDHHQNTLFRSLSEVQHHHTHLVQFSTQRIKEQSGIEYKYRIRPYFSNQHILTVANALELCKKIEAKKKIKQYYDQDFSLHRSLCVSAILAAAAFFEAVINEFFSDAADFPQRFENQMSTFMLERLKAMWHVGIPRTAQYSILEKYQIALAILGLPEFDQGRQPSQDARLIIRLRNALVHYEPDWHETETSSDVDPNASFAKGLRGKFPLNPLTGKSNPFFPDKCLSSGMIEWTLGIILSFADEFHDKVKVIPTYEKVRSLVLEKSS